MIARYKLIYTKEKICDCVFSWAGFKFVFLRFNACPITGEFVITLATIQNVTTFTA